MILLVIIIIIIFCLFYENFENGNKEIIKSDDNIVEQVNNFIDEKDVVLEIGSDSIRTIIINSLLKDSANHLVIEPNPKLLEMNRNGLSFKVTTDKISTYNDLIEKHKLKFNVLVINCRLCFCKIMEVFNTNIRFFDKIFLTNPDKCDLDKIKELGYILANRYQDNYVFLS